MEISVFATTTSDPGVHEDSDTLFFESSGAALTVTEFVAISNHSSPPRTLAGGSTFDFALPKNAVLDSVAVQPPSTLPHKTVVFPNGAAGRYRIAYPIRPGTTKIRVLYHLPYSGSISIAPAVLRPVGILAVKVPPSMQLSTRTESALEYEGEDNSLSVYVARDLCPGRSCAFTLAGVGQLSKSAQAMGPANAMQFPASADPTQEFFLPSQSKRGFVGITNRTLALYYEIPVLFTALLIGTFALLHRRQGSIRSTEPISPSPKGS
jgi:hypothetical protein